MKNPDEHEIPTETARVDPPSQHVPVEFAAERDSDAKAFIAALQAETDEHTVTAEPESTSEQPDAWAMEPLDASKWLEVLGRMEEQYEKGKKAFAAGQWQIALTAFEEVAGNDPNFRDVRQKLGLARDEHQLAQWHAQASAHGEAGRWAEACRVWVQVLRQRPDYRDGDAMAGLLDAVNGLLGQHEPPTEKA